MKIIDIQEKIVPISSEIKNAYISFAKMDCSVVAITTDVKIDGENIVSYQESLQESIQNENLKINIFKLFNTLNYYKFIHGDLKKTNILVDNKMQIRMIDFDKSFFSMSQSIYNYNIKKQIARFLSNWKNKSKFLTAIRSLEKII